MRSTGKQIVDVAVVGGEADLFDMMSQAGSRLGEKLGVVSIQITPALLDRMPGDPRSGSKVGQPGYFDTTEECD